jgi:hypothetical protein
MESDHEDELEDAELAAAEEAVLAGHDEDEAGELMVGLGAEDEEADEVRLLGW